MWEVGRSAHRRIAAWGSHLLAHQVPWLELPDLCWMLGCWIVVDGGLMWLSLLINSDDYWFVCVFCSFWECSVARLRVFGHVSRKCIGLAGFGMVWHGLTEKMMQSLCTLVRHTCKRTVVPCSEHWTDCWPTAWNRCRAEEQKQVAPLADGEKPPEKKVGNSLHDTVVEW